MISSRLRALSFAALAATSAAIAHGGVAGLANPAWAIPAGAGAAIATAVLVTGWRLVARHGEVPAEASLAALIPAMLLAQAGAHAALLAAGATAHDGASGSLALHLTLAVASALLVHGIDRHTVRRAMRASGPRPVETPAPLRAPRRDAVAGRAAVPIRCGRAPPLTA